MTDDDAGAGPAAQSSSGPGSEPRSDADAGSDTESREERLRREHSELLEELRAMIPGAEVLFGFLLAIRFTGQWKELSPAEHGVYYAALVATALALVLFMAPAAHHRLRFRAGAKDEVLRKGNREAIAGSVAMSLALAAALGLVTELVLDSAWAWGMGAGLFGITAWRWWGIALAHAWRERR